MTVRLTGEILYVCSSAGGDPAGRAAIGALVNAVRRDAPSVDVRDVPADALASHEDHLPVRVAVPLGLTDGTDAAARLSDARLADPGLVVARPLGPDWTLAEICVQRLIEAGARKEDAVVLGVEGDHTEAAAAGNVRAARLVGAVWGGPVHVGTVDGPGTGVGEAVRAAGAGGRRVVVAAYLLAPGGAADRLRRSGADLVTAPLLDGGVPDTRLSALIVHRFHQALGVGAPAL